MDGYHDLHLAGQYPSRYPAGYGIERRYSLAAADPLYPVYSRAAMDPYGGYAAPASYHLPEDPYPRPRGPRRRRPPPEGSVKQRPAPAYSLTPKKQPFKKTQKRPQPNEGKPARKAQQDAGKTPKSGGSTLAKETEELHKLFRTGVDSGLKIVKPAEASGKNAVANGVGKKRKADAKKGPPLKKKGKAKNKKFVKEKKQDAKKAIEKVVEPAKPLTEEEKKELEVALDLQKTACKAFAEFFEIPLKVAEPEPEAEVKEVTELDESEKSEAVGDEEKTEDTPKPSKPKLTPEMAKEIEEKSLNFFSKMLAENDELSKLYLDKKDAGTFECLVCHSINPETSKRFSNVTGLVSHASMRRQRRPEHRGFGKAICQVFGWEPLRPNRLIKQVTTELETVKEVISEKAVEQIEEEEAIEEE